MNNNISPKGNAAVPNKQNKANKKKRKFNIIDFFILFLIIAVVGLLIYAISPWSQLKKLWATNETSFQYAVEIRNVDSEFIDCIKNGDAVINSSTKNSLGTVNRIDVKASTQPYYVRDEITGTVEYKPIDTPDKVDITVYVTATAQYEAGVGYTINGCRVAVGEELPLRFPQFAQSGYCVAIATDS